MLRFDGHSVDDLSTYSGSIPPDQWPDLTSDGTGFFALVIHADDRDDCDGAE